MPNTVYNRLADNWRPLCAIAEVAGDPWPERAWAAFEALTSNRDVNAQSVGVKLLQDIRHIFSVTTLDRIRSKELLVLLLALPESPWLEAHRGGRPITDTWLAARLREFGIKPQTMRMGEQLVRGYEVAEFGDAFARYLK